MLGVTVTQMIITIFIFNSWWKKASYHNLYSSFTEYCNNYDAPINLCGISLGGILALNYTLDFPDKVKSLVLIGTPHKIPKVRILRNNLCLPACK